MGLKTAYHESFRKLEHASISGSGLLPVRPEYSSGEVLLGSLYRGLITGVGESRVDLTEIDELPERLADGDDEKKEFWEALLFKPGALASPPTKHSATRQLTPFVPSISNFACVLGGKPRNRWNPTSLLFSAFSSGLPPDEFESFLGSFKDAIGVELETSDDHPEDLFAQFVERNLVALSSDKINPRDIPEIAARTPSAWRKQSRTITAKTPAERLVTDLKAIMDLKGTMTRRHWISLVESIVRLGAVSHFLWTCMITHRIWELIVDAISGKTFDYLAAVEDAWESHAGEQNYLLELMSTDTRLKIWIGRWFQARIGLSIVLHAMDDLGYETEGKIGESSNSDTIAGLVDLLDKAKKHGQEINDHVAKNTDGQNVLSSAGILWEQNARQIACLSGPPKNAQEFARYSLRQLEARDESQATYDQGYFLKKVGRKKAERIGVRGLGQYSVRPGPLALISLVNSTITTSSSASANLGDLKQHFAEYGIHALPDELETGPISVDLRELGLVVDSPDAKGGLSLVNPLPGSGGSHE